MSLHLRSIASTTLCLLIIATAGCSDKSKPYHSGGYALSQLKDDFEQYVHLIHRDHPMTFTDRDALQRTIAARRKLLQDGMSEFEFYSVVAPVGAAVRCGHTRTFLSGQGQAYFNGHARCLPLEIRLLNNGLYVYKDFTPGEAVARGSRVLSIGTHAAAEIIERLRASLHADGTNITYKDYAINLSFARLFTLIFGGSPQFEVNIVEPGSGKRVTKIIAAMTPKQAHQVNKERYPSRIECTRLCMKYSEDGSYAVLTIKDFGYYGEADAFRRPAGDFFARLANDGIGALILDVRGNDGGDPYCSSFVVSRLIDEPVRYFAADTRFYQDLVKPIPVPQHVFTGELFVLTDGWCFSSTAHMLSLLRCHHRGIFIGEETGGSSTCNDASKTHTLKHTGLELNLPRRTFSTSARCLPKGRGIPADIEVHQTIHDLIAGRDAVMEKAISIIISR